MDQSVCGLALGKCKILPKNFCGLMIVMPHPHHMCNVVSVESAVMTAREFLGGLKLWYLDSTLIWMRSVCMYAYVIQ